MSLAPGKSKQKGNRFENKMAKQLSSWMFHDDPEVLQRHLTSGAQKNVYVGDIVPIKQIKWGYFPFLIECKHGYKNNIPTLNNQTLVRDWLQCSIEERNSKSDCQKIIYLIVKFHGYKDLLITDVLFDQSMIVPHLCLNLVSSGEVLTFHIYELDLLLRFNFYKLYQYNKLLMDVVSPSND